MQDSNLRIEQDVTAPLKPKPALNGPLATEIRFERLESSAVMNTYLNYYRCPNDGSEWVDAWSSGCNDKCPLCQAEIQTYRSDEISIPLANELAMQH
jgi:hypothetical protein